LDFTGKNTLFCYGTMGENEGDDGKRFPSDLAKSGALKKTADGFTYLDPAQFHEYLTAVFPWSMPLSWRARRTPTLRAISQRPSLRPLEN
jgi:hypothetical protein